MLVLLVMLPTACRRATAAAPQAVAEQPPAPAAPPLVVTPPPPALVTGPLVAVKIENTPEARPQAGLDAADLVFELITEGGITRFLAIFQSHVPQLVGPIRSARPEDAALLRPFRALYFVSGARQDVLDELQSAGVDFQDEDDGPLWRDPGRSAPHDLFASGPDLFSRTDPASKRLGPVDWIFGDPPSGAIPCPPPCAADPGRSIVVPMTGVSTTSFEYEEAAGVYRRLQDGQPDEVMGGGRIGAANVLVLGTEVSEVGCCDPAGNSLTETQVVGSGPAVALRDGRRYRLMWSKPSAAAQIQVAAPDGSPFRFKLGPTWVLLAPNYVLSEPGG